MASTNIKSVIAAIAVGVVLVVPASAQAHPVNLHVAKSVTADFSLTGPMPTDEAAALTCSGPAGAYPCHRTPRTTPGDWV